MSSNTVVPVGDLGSRMQEHGRIRLGVKTAKAMKSIDTFRFTSADEEAIKQIAELYGGQAKVWDEPKANPPNQFEVITEAKEIRIFLPPGGLSCWYEQWSGGGCVRRCDGVSVELVTSTPAGAELARVPCICDANRLMVCKPHTRLNVILPEVRFGGVWRLETKGWHAAHELPAMEALIDQIQSHSIIEAVLALEKAQAEGGRHKFVVPRLRLPASALALAAGEANLVALHGGHQGMGELNPGPTDEVNDRGEWYDTDNEVVDAELVDEDAGEKTTETSLPGSAGQDEGQPVAEPGQVRPSTETAAGPSSENTRALRTGELDVAEKKLVIVCAEAANKYIIDPDLLRHALARKASAGQTDSTRGLEPEEIGQVIDWCEQLLAETLQVEVRSQFPPKVQLW